VSQLENLDARGLWSLAVDIGLMGSTELDHLLLTGGKFRGTILGSEPEFRFQI
jgi:hypothetical protein